MTDSELVSLARDALPDRLKDAVATIVRGAGAGSAQLAQASDDDGELTDEFERLLGTTLPRSPSPQGVDNADVAFQEETGLGLRTTVVQIRAGRVDRIIGQA